MEEVAGGQGQAAQIWAMADGRSLWWYGVENAASVVTRAPGRRVELGLRYVATVGGVG